MDEALKKLESVDTQESSKAVTRLQKRLGSVREPQLLGELVDYFACSGSTRALKVLSSLKDVQSQDFFSKLNECMHSKAPMMRIPVLRLLAHCLNKQSSWLYKIVQHPLFASILQHLKISHDVLVLTSGLLVLAAILPLDPSQLSRHLPDIFQIFADLATIRTSNRLRLTPKPLYLHLDVAVYYLFLQLYSLFPCNFFTFLRGRYGPTGERAEFNRYIAPLFNFVRFHPGLVVDSSTSETQGDKWRAMEPEEITTLSITMCLDMSISCPLEEEIGSTVPIPASILQNWEPTSFTESLTEEEEDEGHQLPGNMPSEPASHPPPPPPPPLSNSSSISGATTGGCSRSHARQPRCKASDSSTSSPVKHVSPKNTRRRLLKSNVSRGEVSTSDGPNPDGGTGIAGGVVPSVDATASQDTIWSPSMAFDSSLLLCEVSCQPSRAGYHTTSSTVHSSTIPSPSPDTSATASMLSTAHHTPRPMTAPTFTYANYSPTASLASEASSRQPSVQTTPRSTGGRRQMAGNFQDRLMEADPFISSSNRLPRSLTSSPSSTLGGEEVNLNTTPQSVSIRNKVGKFFSLFSSKKLQEAKPIDQDEFVQIMHSDASPHSMAQGSLPFDRAQCGGVGVRRVRGEEEEVGVEAGKELLLQSEGTRHASVPVAEPDSDTTTSKEEEKEEESASDDSTSTVPRSFTLSFPKPRTSVPLPAPASFPGERGPRGGSGGAEGGEVSRQRASHSESADHTVLQQVQERLRELAEEQNQGDDETQPSLSSDRERGERGRGERGSVDVEGGEVREQAMRSTTPTYTLPQQESVVSSLPDSYPGLHSKPINTVDSTQTLVGSLSSPGLASSSRSITGASLDTDEPGAPLHGVPSSSSLFRERRGSGLVMRRVSVCDRKESHGANFETQTSKTSSGGGKTRGTDSIVPSPVVLLDQLVHHGEIVHEGSPRDIPLAELEGIDWFHFGGCPHSEELGQMQSQVALLHSQLLFERHQCLQHDRRNRRLLSKARNEHRVREELEQLRDQCWRESMLRQSLEQQVQLGEGAAGEAAGQGAGQGGGEGRLREENSALSEENRMLQENNHRLTVELCRAQQENSRLNRDNKETKERVFALESELTDLQPRLAQTGSLLEKVATLERELLVLNQLYRDTREESLSLLARSRAKQEWVRLTNTLKQEKEAAERESAGLQQETEGLRHMVASLREEVGRAEEEKTELQQILQHVQGRCQEKIKASEEKYEAIVAVTHQLESHITELRARNFSRKKASPHRNKRSSSHPTDHRTGSSPTSRTTPSPVTPHTYTPTSSLD